MRIKVCASSANLGPGFDTLGLALSLYNEYEVKLADELKISGCPKEYSNEHNLFYIGFKKVMDYFNKDYKADITIKTNIPIARGLGSSSSMIVGGIASANYLLGKPLNDEEMLKMASAIEGHPDNVAPCIYGNLCVCVDDEDKYKVMKYSIDQKYRLNLLVGKYELETKLARSVLPNYLSYRQAIYNMGHLVSLIEGLQSGNSPLLALGAKDLLHEPYRASLIKDYEAIKDLAYKFGALTFNISGAGPSILMLSENEYLDKDVFKDFKDYEFMALDIADRGIIYEE